MTTHQVHLLKDAKKIYVMDEGTIIESGTYKQINQIETSVSEQEDSKSVDSSNLSVLDHSNISINLNRMNSIVTPKRQNSVSSPLRKDQEKRSISVTDALKRMKSNISMSEAIPDELEYQETPVRFKDWIRLYSFGIGNFWAFFSYFLSLIFSLLLMFCYYLIGKLAEKDKDEQQESNIKKVIYKTRIFFIKVIFKKIKSNCLLPIELPPTFWIFN